MSGFHWIIATRNPSSGRLIVIVKDEDLIAEFDSEEDAQEAAENTSVCKAWGYELIEVSK